MDARTIITLATIIAVLVASFAFLIFNPGAKKVRQQNVESSAKELVDDSTKNRQKTQ